MTEPGNDSPRAETAPSGAPAEPPTVGPAAWQPPVHEAPPAGSGRRWRTGWVILGVGLGCLTPIVLALLFWGTAELFFAHRLALHGSSYAAHVRAWQHAARGAPANGDLRAFQKQLDNWVFEQNGRRVQADAGHVVSYAAETEFAAEGTSGVSIVTLVGESGKKVRLYVSFDEKVDGEWEFRLDMYR